MSVFHKQEGIDISMSNLGGFDMSFDSVMNKVYDERQKVDATYGTKPFVSSYDDLELQKIDFWIRSQIPCGHIVQMTT